MSQESTMGVSPVDFREQGCCDVVRHCPVWETRGEQLYRQQVQWPRSRKRMDSQGQRAPEVAEWKVGQKGERSGKSRTHRQVLVDQAGLLTTTVTTARYLTKTAYGRNGLLGLTV